MSYDLLTEWSGSWYCYWTGEFGLPANPNTDYVFSPCLSVVEGGKLATSSLCPAVSASSSPEVLDTVTRLLALQARISADGARCSLAGSESDYEWIPFGISWPALESDKVEPATFLKHINAHPEISSRVRLLPISRLRGAGDEEGQAGGAFGGITSDVLKFLDPGMPDEDAPPVTSAAASVTNASSSSAASSGNRILAFYAGSEKLNPVPLFIVSRLSADLVGGFVSAVIHT